MSAETASITTVTSAAATVNDDQLGGQDAHAPRRGGERRPDGVEPVLLADDLHAERAEQEDGDLDAADDIAQVAGPGEGVVALVVGDQHGEQDREDAGGGEHDQGRADGPELDPLGADEVDHRAPPAAGPEPAAAVAAVVAAERRSRRHPGTPGRRR
jgi:hypothetical protein